MSIDVTDAVMQQLVSAAPVGLLGDQQPLDPGWTPGDSLQSVLEKVLANPTLPTTLRKHSYAVVDLTDDPLAPVYAGHRDLEQRKVASLAKLLALYGAYSLRADLNALIPALSITDQDTMGTALRDNYQLSRASSSVNPKVEYMFEPPSDSGTTNFESVPLTDEELIPFYKHTHIDPYFLQHPLREYLRLMAGWSDDTSATNVIRGLGFDYLWQRAKRSGMYHADEWPVLRPTDQKFNGRGGLFLGQDYSGAEWQSAPNGTRPAAANPTPSNQAANARSVAFLLTLLAQDKLVADYAGNAGMRELLRKTNSDFTSMDGMEDSSIGMGLAAAGWRALQAEWDEDTTPVPPPPDPTADLAVSKIGYLKNSPVINNGLLVRTTRSGVTITAVLVVINNVSNQEADLIAFGKAIAPELAALHGVT